jgi:4-hydroxy-3-polyprenylbenzoate decarboxylase
MAYRNLRDLIAVLEQRGKLKRIAHRVDRSWEIACLARWGFQALPEEDRFGLLFEDVEGFDMAAATGVIGASREAYAIALGAEPDEINERWVAALRAPVAPRQVKDAASQEVVLRGTEADLGRIPIPVWTPGKDGAPYISCPVVTRDRDNGIYNVGVYRTMVRDGHSVAVNLGPRRHGRRCCDTFLEKGEAAPIAWVVGGEPVIPMAAVANVPYEVDEFGIAGALQGEPVELVRAKSIDLLVPANAEIVIEGEILPGEMAEEGPFGEFAGYMGAPAKKLRARITAITQRKKPIYYGFISQMPPSESTTLQSLGYAGTILKQLRHDLGHETVRDVYVDPTFGGQLAHGIVAMKPLFPGHAKLVGRLVADVTTLKRVTVVDEDVDIRDPMHMAWAMNSRFSPARDTILIENVFAPRAIDPTVRVRDGVAEPSSKIVCDATQDGEAEPLSLPSKEMMAKALASWKAAGLPEFDVPKRVALMLERS